MSRLPLPGADAGAWGDILNDYLSQEHNADGTHNVRAVLNIPLSGGLVPISDAVAPSGITWQPSSTLQGSAGREVELQTNATHIQWRYLGDSAWTDLVALTEITGPPGPDGQQGQPGLGVALGGAAGQFLRKQSLTNYDTAWGTLSKAEVGLGNVDNTSDINKPLSTAAQTAIDTVRQDALALAVVL